jgi:hypothetical protein
MLRPSMRTASWRLRAGGGRRVFFAICCAVRLGFQGVPCAIEEERAERSDNAEVGCGVEQVRGDRCELGL